MPTSQIVLTMSLDPFLDGEVAGGALRLLGVVRGMAGHARMIRTLTCSLATRLGRCVNTIRNYRDALVEAGYIWWTTNKRTGVVTILIRESVEPPSRRAKFEAERQAEWPRAPAPRGGAQKIGAIKSRLIPAPCTLLQPVDRLRFHEPLRSVAEQIAFCLGEK